MNIKQIAENSRGTWPTVSYAPLELGSITATTDVSLRLPGSLSKESFVPSMGALQTSLYSWYPLTTLDTVNACTIFVHVVPPVFIVHVMIKQTIVVF